MSDPDTPLLTVPLDSLHRELGAKMVPFAGYSMPVQYPAGVMTEHLHTRAEAGLFDVSHMGQVEIKGAECAQWLESLVPGDIQGLGIGKTRYTVFTNDQGGILDDLMVSKLAEDHLFLVTNAACKNEDFAHMKAAIGAKVALRMIEDRALLALQGPKAAAAMAMVCPDALSMTFMTIRETSIAGIACLATRSGYTGEDGWEISVPTARAEDLARTLLALPGVMPIGLGARDSLRLEAGLCLYGSDIDTTITPVEGNIAWIMNKRRRAEGGFPGAAIIQKQLAEGSARLRVGIQPLGRAPARAHTEITDEAGNRLGEICSGGFGPSADRPVAMGYVPKAFSAVGTKIKLVVRGKALDAEVAALPFVPHRYFKG
ncbi:glycine cleavage system protein T [Paramagnetospirillum kuznetsovii]|uniref:aminomethyltransferase n=1 Tax=Paramagnetospirillum kuznetsovii TaxID=2053833 RepID=A0A364P1X9_9PROT|nr:glycine cleavage system aminomethyltransferase GcvT [Paramagnetospirillum kuznetsovii]RAU23323.1 glycine cleavage system protein T [Paramagnetospirillum kuznetsovii]